MLQQSMPQGHQVPTGEFVYLEAHARRWEGGRIICTCPAGRTGRICVHRAGDRAIIQAELDAVAARIEARYGGGVQPAPKPPKHAPPVFVMPQVPPGAHVRIWDDGRVTVHTRGDALGECLHFMSSLAELRRCAGLTQMELAWMASSVRGWEPGLWPQTICDLERCLRPARLRTLHTLAQALGVPSADLCRPLTPAERNAHRKALQAQRGKRIVHIRFLSGEWGTLRV